LDEPILFSPNKVKGFRQLFHQDNFVKIINCTVGENSIATPKYEIIMVPSIYNIVIAI
jgi:hypothetical protein